MSRRPFVEPSDDDEDFSEQDWETEGSGASAAHRLYVSLGSIKAGNSSLKLKHQVFSLLDSLVGLGAIYEKQKKKLFVFI